MIDRSHIGYTTLPTTVTVDPFRVRLFCEATGETDPAYVDDAAARAAGLARRAVPTTYLKVLENEHFNAARVLQHLGVPLRAVLHGEQSFDVRVPVHVGDLVEIDRRIVDIADKKNGALTIVTLDTRFRLGGRVAATSRQTVVVRNALGAT
jgi:acyl dehydratase